MSTEDADELMKLIACFSEHQQGASAESGGMAGGMSSGTAAHASVEIAGILDDLQQELSLHSDAAQLDFAPLVLPAGPETSASVMTAGDTGATDWLFVDA